MRITDWATDRGTDWGTDWDDAYANGAYIDGVDEIVAGWARRSDGLRAAQVAEVLQIGTGERPVVDLYRPDGPAQGLSVIVHGGYWMAFSGRDFAHLAAGPLARGQVVAMVSYTLAPEASISQITREVAAAVTAAAGCVDGPIRLAGHSAGGHLVTRMICEGVLPDEVAERIVHVMSISGLHDLRPLRQTAMNHTLGLTETEAISESPALLNPRAGARVSCVVGADERPEFRRQNALLANIWHGLGAETSAVELAGEHHFSVIAGLEHPDGHLTEILLT